MINVRVKKILIFVTTFLCCLWQSAVKGQDLYRIKEGYHYGFIDEKGRKVLPCIYANAGEFKDGLAPVRLPKGLFGYINERGEWLIKPKYDYARTFSEGLAVVFEKDKPKVIDNQDNIVIESISYRNIFHDSVTMKWIDLLDFKNRKSKCVFQEKYYYDGFGSVQNNAIEINLDSIAISSQKKVFLKKTKYVKLEREDYAFDFKYNKMTYKLNDENDLEYINSSGDSVFTQKQENGFFYQDSIDTVNKIYSEVEMTGSTAKTPNFEVIPYFKDSAYIYVDTTNVDQLRNRYKAYLVNTRLESIIVSGVFDTEVEALNANDEWILLTNRVDWYCESGLSNIIFENNNCYEIGVPLYTGNYKTKLRLRFSNRNLPSCLILSNPFVAYINYAQLIDIQRNKEMKW